MTKIDEPKGCGISWLYMTGQDDPFYAACVEHDKGYLDPSINIDNKDSKFLQDTQQIAASHNSWYLKLRSYVFYALVRLWAKTYRKFKVK